jgi:hypothetical protein
MCHSASRSDNGIIGDKPTNNDMYRAVPTNPHPCLSSPLMVIAMGMLWPY